MDTSTIDETKIKQKFGQVVRRLRKRRTELSQEEFGFELGCHRTYVSQIERGIRNPSLGMIFKIALALEIPASEMLALVETEE